MNCGLKKKCCGSYCIVAGSEKCCAHEARISWSNARSLSCWFPNMVTRRYYCSPCQRHLDQIHLKGVISSYEYTDASDAVCVGNRIVAASCKTDCRHYCRNGHNETCCCVCKLKTNASCPKGKDLRFVQVCDCCLPRLPTPRKYKETYRTFKRVTKATSPRLARPTLNCSLKDDLAVEDDCSGEFLTSDDEVVDGPKQPISSHTTGSIKEATQDLFALNELNWPTILPNTSTTQSNEVDGMGEQCSLPDSVVFLESDLIDADEKGDEWEVLSNADSVWTWESRDPGRATCERPNSFRDAILSSKTAPNTSIPTSVGASVKKALPLKVMTRIVEHTESSDEEGDILAKLYDEYKTGRGGKHKWRYKRGQKGNRGSQRMWPDGYIDEADHRNRKDSDKRECRSLVSSFC